MTGRTIDLPASRPVVLVIGIGLLLMALVTMFVGVVVPGRAAIGIGVGSVAAFGALATVYVIKGVGWGRYSAALGAPAPDERADRGRALRLGYGIRSSRPSPSLFPRRSATRFHPWAAW